MIPALATYGGIIAMPIFGDVYRKLRQEAKKVGLDCYACDEPLKGDRQTHADHLIPASHRPGGRKAKQNNQVALGLMCAPCNIQKSDTPFLEYARENPQVARGLRKQAQAIEENPNLKSIAQEQRSLADKAEHASKWRLFG
jgi:hypothetical protein